MLQQTQSCPDHETSVPARSITADGETPSQVIGSINGVPVIHVTDLGPSWYSDAVRRVKFILPGDSRVHRAGISVPCTIPRHYTPGRFVREGSPLAKTGFFLVHQVTAETRDALAEGVALHLP